MTRASTAVSVRLTALVGLATLFGAVASLDRAAFADDAQDEAFVQQTVGGTEADAGLQQDILRNLLLEEKLHAPDCTPTQVQAQHKEDGPDGAVVEQWTVDGCGTHQYEIDIMPAPSGGAVFRVHPMDGENSSEPAPSE